MEAKSWMDSDAFKSQLKHLEKAFEKIFSSSLIQGVFSFGKFIKL